MLVLHIHDRWSAMGGADWHLISLLDSMPHGVETAGLFGRTDGSVPDRHLPRGGLHFVKKLDKRTPFHSEHQVGQSLRSFIKTRRPDVIHVHNILHPLFLNILAETGRSVISVQDHRFFCPGRGKVRTDGSLCHDRFGLGCAGCFQEETYFFRLTELVRARLDALQGFAGVIVLSEYMKNELVLAGIPADKVSVIPPFVHGLDLTSGPAVYGRDILFAGRIVWAKGIFDLLEAMAQAENEPRLVLAGHSTISDQVERRIAELGLANRIDHRGWVSHVEMADLYRRARAVVMPSLWQEPFGITGLEAQALGRPVLAYDVGGIREWLVDGQTGILVPPGNVLALTAGIQVLLREGDLATELGRNGRRITLERFDRDRLMTRLTDLYGRVAKG